MVTRYRYLAFIGLLLYCVCLFVCLFYLNRVVFFFSCFLDHCISLLIKSLTSLRVLQKGGRHDFRLWVLKIDLKMTRF